MKSFIITCSLWRNVETCQKYFSKKRNNYWEGWLNTGSNFIASVVFSPYSFSCSLSVILFTKMLSGYKEQGFWMVLHEYVLPAIFPNCVWVFSESSLWAVVWCMSPGSRDGWPERDLFVGLWVFDAEWPIPITSVPCRVPPGGCSRKFREAGHETLLGCLSLLVPAPCCVWWEYQPWVVHLLSAVFCISGKLSTLTAWCSQELRPQ